MEINELVSRVVFALNQEASELSEMPEPYWDIQTIRELAGAFERGDFHEKLEAK